ncbi:MAG TPA: alkaline phosphatase family protein [Labilithrix sp.]|nr:alkaline phosphatase family protein [Labilithrix sp.]
MIDQNKVMFRRSLLLAALLPIAALACADRVPSSPVREPAPARAPAEVGSRAPVVVGIVVDQLSAWVAEERLPLLPKDGGFAWLRREGTWAKRLRLPYAVTDTAPGHASLHTGKVPAESGIWGNELPDATKPGRVSFLRDGETRMLTPDGPRDAHGSSAKRLRVDTVADRLRAARPDALVVTISLKDRGAILPGGKHPSVALWFDVGAGTFVTSTAFASTFPKWAAPIAGPRAVEEARSSAWTPSDVGWLERNVGMKDDAAGEGDLDGFGTTFPHVAKSSAAFRASPAGDKVILDLALAALAAEYDANRPTLLLLSLSTTDIVGHVFGPDSWEAWDQLRKLDAALGDFFRELQRRLGDFSVVLAADHGNSSMPEVVRARRPATCDGPTAPAADPYERPICTVGSRIEPDAIQTELRAEATKVLGKGSWIFGVADPYVFLSTQALALDPARRALLDGAVRSVFDRRKAAIAEVLDVRVLEKRCPEILSKARGIPERALPGDDVLTLVCRSWSPNAGAGDYYMVPRLGSFFESDIVPGKGAGHGGPGLYDRTVPLIVRAKGAVDANTVISEPVDFTAYSRLLGALLGLDAAKPREILAGLRAVPAK